MHGPDPHAADPHAAAPAAHGAAADPHWNAWLGGLLLLLAALTLLFVWPARHSSGENRAPAPVVHADKPAKPGTRPGVKASDDQRMAEVLAALTGHGIADDSVPQAAVDDIQFVIRTVAQSGCSFRIDGEPKTATDVSEWMIERWKDATEPIYSAETLIYRTTGHLLVDQKLNRVIFPDGSEQGISNWLLTKLAERHGTAPPPAQVPPALPPPRAGKKTVPK